ncbi:hypothetical protein B0I35DRAFT_454545 [Stachybotrys elegans]|uniref:Uncharacterized protein n=1 Tax=Stachybotrys elegans TaxID=80388 RepID=A0A8K0SI18_9HYPO|nr:hypothetical protein B0I35DRAFT_454545 [Stachybotrys elegans]
MLGDSSVHEMIGGKMTAPLQSNPRQLLDESMQWLDRFYDPSYGYLHDVAGSNAMRHNTRSSSWYALGLLARNKNDDVLQAEKIIANLANAQFKDPSLQWYGDYQKYPEEPVVGSPNYKAVPYKTWDPNWRGFVGTTLILIYEEYSKLLSRKTKQILLDSVYLATKGDTYRVGGVDGDNLYPAYSNPIIMRAFMSAWVGRKMKDTNMTETGELEGHEIFNLFKKTRTLSEFNSPTYTGVSLYGLTLWSRYLPKESILRQAGPEMIGLTWKTFSEQWHFGMKNVAGPWDRGYGFDMQRYATMMGMWLWALNGRENSGMSEKPYLMSHANDYAFGPLIAELADYHRTLLPRGLLDKLKSPTKEHTYTAQAYYPPYDLATRNITTWVSEKMTIGAQSFVQTVVGGPTESKTQWSPAVVHWARDQVAFLSLYSTETALEVEVAANYLSLKYPLGNKTSIFSLVIGTFPDALTIASLDEIPGLEISTSGNVDPNYKWSFVGQQNAGGNLINDFEYWNCTFVMPATFEGVPTLVLDLKVI